MYNTCNVRLTNLFILCNMNLLLLTHKMPFPLHDGGAFSIYHSALGLLSKHVNIKILSIDTNRNQQLQDDDFSDFISRSRLESVKVDTRIRPLPACLNLFMNQSYFVKRFYSEAYQSALTRILVTESFDIVQLEHSYMGLYIETIRKYSEARIILRPQNFESQVWRRLMKGKMNLLKKWYIGIATRRLERFEARMTAEVDGIIAISAFDEKSFSKCAPDTPVINVPVGLELSNFRFPPFQEMPDGQLSFYHLGSMDWAPNIEGVRWFVEEVIPYIIKDYPGFRFYIAGKNMPSWLCKRRNLNLIVEGEIDDPVAFHLKHSVMVVPLLSGGGIRVKIIEGMALGKTIITTTIGAEGIPYTNLKNILIADTKQDFAEQIKRCTASPDFCRYVGEQARKLAETYFNCNSNAQKMIQFYQHLCEHSNQ